MRCGTAEQGVGEPGMQMFAQSRSGVGSFRWDFLALVQLQLAICEMGWAIRFRPSHSLGMGVGHGRVGEMGVDSV